jgi:CRISPR-associated endonuclease/helicase Cas3
MFVRVQASNATPLPGRNVTDLPGASYRLVLEMLNLACAWSLWGKTGKEGAWHPALAHMMDVGAVAELLARYHAARLTELLGLHPDDAVRWASFLIAAHDVGKLAPGFEQKAVPFEGWTFPPGLPLVPQTKSVGFDHALESVVALERWLPDRLGGDRSARSLARALARSVGAHHGSFHSEAELNTLSTDLDHASARRGGWQAVQDLALDWLWGVFVGPGPIARPEATNVSTLVMWLAGLATECDWVGSDAWTFALTNGTIGPGDYVAVARRRALEAVDRRRLLAPSPLARVLSFPDMYDFVPRPLQVGVAGLDLTSPGLLLVEAPMGEGKTEAGLYAAARMQGAHTAGVYLALPTQATSNAMHRRVQGPLRRLDPDAPRIALTHSAAALAAPLRPNTPGRRHEGESWFAGKRKGLLALNAVGTVDQLEMGGMRVKHGFVRLFGLANKAVVIDEAHAYDAYMGTIIRRTLRWLGELRVPVVVLSATLPSRTRSRLVEAYTGEPCPELPVAYPLVTFARCGEPPLTVTPSASGRMLDVALERVETGENAVDGAVARSLLDGIAGGGCAAWIVNTVREAQDAYRLVRALAADDVEVLLFTSRFRMADRRRIERGVLRRYGPQGQRPRRSLLIATQVVEQSLDLDFDLMATHLAPIDLILQRLGRLHRHRRRRPPGLASPRLIVTHPADRGEPTRWGPSGFVYDPIVLRPTLDVLKGVTSIAAPGDIRRLVEAVYSQLPEDHGIDEEAQARDRVLPVPHPRQPAFDGMATTFEDDEGGRRWIDARTRLGRESRDVILLHRCDGVPCLEADGRGRVDLEVSRLDDRLARRLALRTVRVDHRGLVDALDPAEVPRSINEHPILLRHKLLVLAGGRQQVGRVHVRYDRTLGLEIVESDSV